jgi:hypothetical protein
MTLFLVPVGRDRFELYSEPPEEPVQPLDADAGRFKRWAHAANLQWHALVDRARSTPHSGTTDPPGPHVTATASSATPNDGQSSGRLARWRDQVICRLAETIAEQRTLWSLRKEIAATVRFPSSIDAAKARTVLDRALAAGQRHHGWWLIVDLLLFIASGILFFVPGPNIVAYYIAFRVVGHLNSWRGARQGAQGVAWTFEPDANLAELGTLVDLPCETRAPRVAAIAARLNLTRLTAFFERVAA